MNKTPENLDDLICNEMHWRRREITNIKLLHDRAKEHEKLVLRRAGVALLYAHWEGYVKNVSRIYLRHVLNMNLNANQLCYSLFGLSLKHDLVKESIESSSGVVLEKIGKHILENISKTANFDPDKSIKTKSNLTAKVFKDIVTLLGLNYSNFEIYEKTVIQKLIKNRNEIAHGEFVQVDEEDYQQLHEKIQILFELFRTEVSNSAVLSKYKIA